MSAFTDSIRLVAVVVFEHAHDGRSERYEFSYLGIHLVDDAVARRGEECVVEDGFHLEVKARPVEKVSGLRPGMTVIYTK